jgi:hypothetical protein
MNTHDATEQAYKNGYEAGKKDALKKKSEESWQPTGAQQFALACAVCLHGREIGGDTCRNCLSEVESGFAFDVRQYMIRQLKEVEKKYTFVGGQRGGGKILRLEQMLSAKCAQLEVTEKERDRWKSAALFYRDLYIKQKQEEIK